MTERLIYHFINDDDFLHISNKIKEFELQTAGEISVSIKEKRKFSQRNKSIKEIAEEEFFRLGIDKTRDKTGILIFLMLTDRQFHIMADKGIHEKVSDSTWDDIKNQIQDFFVKGKFAEGLIWGVEEVGKILAKHFPIKPDDTNEISNRVVLS